MGIHSHDIGYDRDTVGYGRPSSLEHALERFAEQTHDNVLELGESARAEILAHVPLAPQLREHLRLR